MINTNFKSIDTVLERILRNPLMNGVTKADIAQDVADCLILIGAPMSYEEKLFRGVVTEHRTEIPCDLLYIIQTRQKLENDHIVPMRYATDTFQSSYHQIGSPDFAVNSDSTYSVNRGFIYTSFEEGFVEMMYMAVTVDDEGLPMIPDDPSFEKALQYYVMAQHFEVLFMLGKITDKSFDYIQQQRDWYVAQSSTKAIMPLIDQSESMRSSFSRMIYDENQAKTNFVNSGNNENFNWNGFTRRNGALGTGTFIAHADIDE